MNFSFFWDDALNAEQVAAVVKAAKAENATQIGDFVADENGEPFAVVAFKLGNTGYDNIAAALRIGRAAGVGGEIAYRYGNGWRMFKPF